MMGKEPSRDINPDECVAMGACLQGGVLTGAVNSIVRISALGGNTISATISNAAVEDLGLKDGEDVLAVIKATSVMVGIDE